MIYELLEQFAKNSLTFKRLVRWHRARIFPRPNWKEIIEKNKVLWKSSLKVSKNGPKILIATSVGRYWTGTTLESLLAVALTLRGANVHFLLCDTLLPSCLECRIDGYPDQKYFVRYGPSKDICRYCFSPANALLKPLGLQVHRYSEFMDSEKLNECEYISSTIPVSDISNHKMDGVNVGEHALAGTLRFYARGTLDGEPDAELVLRRYFKSSLLTTYVAQRLLKKYSFECIAFHHGIYVPQGVIGDVARKEKVRVVNWNPAYRRKCFVFSHGNTYHHTLMLEPVSKWENMKWSTELENDIMDYLKTRWKGTYDWIAFLKNANEDLSAITHELQIDFSKPTIGMLTNVMWDAQLHYPANAFPNMLDWVLKTIHYFAKRPELQLVIRVHPAEITGFLPSRQRIVDEIKNEFSSLPTNVFIIPPESRVSTYTVMLKCNAVIIYGTKTGVELTSRGIPVIVAGEAWIRNKALTIDAESVEHYFEILERLPFSEGMSEAQIERARKYAYHFFFRRMIPLEFMEPTNANPPHKIKLSGLPDLLPGRSRGLDVICEGVLNGTDFIYPAEQLPTEFTG